MTRRDRTWHETTALVEIIYQAGVYDQLNMGANCCIEVAVRRLLQNVEAYSKGLDSPNWDSAKHLGGASSPLDLVPDDMRAFAGKLQKEENEVELMRSRARAAGQSNAVTGDSAGAAVAVGALPMVDGDAGGGTRRARGGRGRGRRPAHP